MGEVPELRTERLLLRGFRDADRDPFAALNADPLVTRHLQGTLTRERSDAFVDRIAACWAERGWGLWALEHRESGTFLGYTGLWPADFLPSGPGVEVGWRLAAHAWGRGYAPEAARAALRFGFEQVGLPEIVSFTARGNTASLRVMEKIGLRPDPTRDFDHPRVDADAYPELVAHLFHALTQDEWAATTARDGIPWRP
ncbi:GNAT family N-acetyltransferase [Ornithinimicrobium tianjinense]|uniref:N-acetyltransferase n=1 Tax=Ornithinimicrobium tianjinense TaxID=1195761 RepID=A0A917BHV9_9MICO|nr:GNAT family N-acetyltransferase [Ornithinimicrobium tianjinense]GGF42760.1 N-acetyltransferase [Ornithinimicrobium tianjinense]